jgi:hypothetical protein
MKTGCVGFTGSRTLRHAQDATLPAAWSGLVEPVVLAVVGSGRGIAVGCAPGADALVRALAPGARVFAASDYGTGRWAYAARSQALVRAVLASGPGAGLVGFVAVSGRHQAQPPLAQRGDTLRLVVHVGFGGGGRVARWQGYKGQVGKVARYKVATLPPATLLPATLRPAPV